MRTKLLLGAFLMISLFGCKKPTASDFQSTGIITGADYRMLACGGNWYILIDNVTYEFEILPDGSTIDLQNETFPITVKLEWKLSTKPTCTYKNIDILKIVKQ